MTATLTPAKIIVTVLADGRAYGWADLLRATGLVEGRFKQALSYLVTNQKVIKDGLSDDCQTRYYLVC